MNPQTTLTQNSFPNFLTLPNASFFTTGHELEFSFSLLCLNTYFSIQILPPEMQFSHYADDKRIHRRVPSVPYVLEYTTKMSIIIIKIFIKNQDMFLDFAITTDLP